MSLGTAVLVHGGWSNPDDWFLVTPPLHDRDIAVVAPDLPSHRSGEATLGDDAEVVEAAIHGAQPPVVIVGWSYGGKVLSELSDLDRVKRLVYVAAVPERRDLAPADVCPAADLDVSHVLFPDAQTCVLDDDWWLEQGDGATFPAPVVAHLHAHRRRPISLAALLSNPSGEPWRSVATTVLLGRSDSLVPEPAQQWAAAHFDDVRPVDADHFIPFRRPDAIVDVVAEALGPSDAAS
jgi:pimeloyl-ACP methyl ester carboxylesterase